MKRYRIFTILLVGCILYSCSSHNKLELKNTQTINFITELALNYWDLNYRFPTSYQQSRDTDVWFFAQYAAIDSVLLCNSSKIKYMDCDTALLITYYDDTLAFVNLPCSCDYTDDVPNGPRAFDSNNCQILNDYIQVDENVYTIQLSHDLAKELNPIVNKKMNRIGYVRVPDIEKKHPQYLLIEYLSMSDSIHLINACEKYSCYFYEEYANILRSVLSEFCKKNHVARLLTPVNVYLIAAEDSLKCKGHGEDQGTGLSSLRKSPNENNN